MNNQLAYSNEYSFISEARGLVRILQETKNRPIKPSSEIFKVILKKDDSDWNSILENIKINEKEAAEKAVNSADIYKEIVKCDQKMDTSKCPQWRPWGQWSSCLMCGQSMQSRKRTGCQVGSRDVDTVECETDSNESRRQEKACLIYQEL